MRVAGADSSNRRLLNKVRHMNGNTSRLSRRSEQLADIHPGRMSPPRVALPLDRAHPEHCCHHSLLPRRPHKCSTAPMRPATSFLIQHAWSSTAMQKGKAAGYLGQDQECPQEVQKGQWFSPAQALACRHAFSRARPQQAKRRRGTNRTLCDPFALTRALGERRNPSSACCFRETISRCRASEHRENNAWDKARLGAPGLGRVRRVSF